MKIPCKISGGGLKICKFFELENLLNIGGELLTQISDVSAEISIAGIGLLES